jgi:ATP-dependent Lhr-like helicase
MIRRVKRAHSKDEVLRLMEPLVAQWFNSKFDGLTEPQSYAVPLIHGGKNVLVSSPTGSGKTLTAFLSIINELMKLSKKDKLEDKIYCVYISPLKALANDINKNLTAPLSEMVELAQTIGMLEPQIRTAIRHGDTSPAERQKMSKKPPHIFITTPETLSIVLSTPKFRFKFSDVKYVIVDEIHEICSSKRGTNLSLALERLQAYVKKDFVRIGLSATIAPINEVANFLVGRKKGRSREVNVTEVEGTKQLDMKVLCPVPDILSLPSEIVNSKMIELLKGLIEKSRTALIFTNTRSGTESVVYKLKERGLEDIEAHHGSLSKYTRLDVEDRLKKGELNAVVSSTSLELGIDIGYIDLVCQIGSPKSIAKGLQRIGRSGHAYGDISRGRILVFDNDDLIECATLTKNAYDNRIDRVDIPSNCLDVLAQNLIGMSIEKIWEVDEAYELVRRSYSFKSLSKRDFLEVLEYLSSREPEHKVYSKIWFDRDENVFGRKKGSRLIYYTNVGTIPEEGSYTVISERGISVGELSEKFIEHLSSGDVFVLGGRPYQFERTRGMRVYVKRAEGRRPTVPSWAGEMLPRSFDLANEVGKFRGQVAEKLKEGKEEARKWLIEEHRVDVGSANSIINYIEEQKAVIPIVPTDRDFLIEGYEDLKGNWNVIFHFCLGRRVNDTLSRAYAFVISTELKCNIKVSITDDNFMLTLQKQMDIDRIPKLLKSAELEGILKKALRNTELFKQRFRHCATRSFMILRNYKGHELSVGRQQLRSSRVLDYLHKLEGFPIIKETYNEIQNQVMDLKNAKGILRRIEEGEIEVHTSDYSSLPSPLSHNVVLLGISDMVLMEDRSALLRELHRQVLRRIVPDISLTPGIDPSQVEEYFQRKFKRIKDEEDLMTLMRTVGPINLTQRRGVNIFQFSDIPPKKLSLLVKRIVSEGKVQSIHTPAGALWVPTEDVGSSASIYAKTLSLSKLEQKALDSVKAGPKTTKALASELEVESKKALEILKRLERGFEVHRTIQARNEVIWSFRKVQKDNRRKSRRRAILQRIELGPMTVHELSYHLGLAESDIGRVLTGLEKADTIAKGNFLGEEHEQFMLMKDLVRISAPKIEKRGGGEISIGKIATYLHGTQFNIPNIRAYFDVFMDAAMPFDVFNHVENFDLKEWERLRKDSHILQGRFISGRVRYIRKDYSDLLASAYRIEGLNAFDKKVLKAIAESRGITFNVIAKRLNADRDDVRASLDHLDSNLYVIRKFAGGFNQNTYVPFEPGKQIDDYLETIILNYLKGYGPAKTSSIRKYSHLSYGEIESKLKELESSGKIARIRTELNDELVMLPEGIERLKATEPSEDMPLRILSIFDPYAQQIWAQISARYGGQWVFPVVKGGELLGMVEKWEMSGCIEVRDIDIDVQFLDDVLKDLDRVMEYYNQHGYEIIRITGAMGRSIRAIEGESLDIFKRNGYSWVQEYLVKGNVNGKSFDKAEVTSYIFWKQGILSEKYAETIELVNAQGGLRTDVAGRLRLSEHEGLERLTRKGALLKVHAIPDYLSYVTPQLARLYKKAMSFKLGKYEKLIMRVVEEEGPISRKKLFELSPVGYGNTTERLKKLYNRGQLAKDGGNSFLSIENTGISREEARRRIIRNLFENFGIFSAENLAMYTKFEFKMGELRAILKELEDEGYLEKGYFVKGDNTLYWMVKDEIPRIGTVQFNHKLVLTQFDNLWLYLQSEIRDSWGMGSCFVVFEGTKMIAAFKGKIRNGGLTFTDFKGARTALRTIKEFAASNNLTMKEEFEKIDDWEVMTLYEKVKGKSLETNEKIYQ